MMSNLSCDDTPTGDMYIFYKHIDKYLKYGKICTSGNKCDRYKDKCGFKGITPDEKADIHTNICKRFKYLINNIFNEMPQQKLSNEEADGKYLIYWLNHEIHMQKANICPKDLLQHMRTLDPHDKLLPKLRNYMYYIEDDDVNNMNVLYLLYNNYKEMNEIIDSDVPTEKTFMTYAKNCVEKYKSLNIECNGKHKDFCNYLNAFKEKYDKIDLSIDKLNVWVNRTLPSLNNNEPTKAEITRPSLTNGEHSEIGSNHNTPRGEASVMQTTPSPTLSSDSVATRNTLPKDVQGVYIEKNRQIEGINEDDLGVDKKIIGTIITTLGFTSLGSFLRRRTNSKKKLMHNFDEKGNYFLDASEYQHIYPDRESYKIAYNSG